MATICVAVLWGVGIGSGLLGPLIVFVILIRLIKWISGDSDTQESFRKSNEDSLAALLVRNELTVQQNDLAVRAVEQFVRVAEAAEAIRWRYVDGV